MDDVELANYVAGIEPGPIEAWRVDHGLANALGVKPGTVVLLSDYTLTKTRYKHPEIIYSDYQKLPEILACGFVTLGKRKRTIELCHIDTSNTYNFKLWRVCLKATRKNEVFVTLFHRLDMKEARRLHRRAQKQNTLLRDHLNELARRMLRRASHS